MKILVPPLKQWKKMSPPIPPYKFFTFHPSLNWDVKKTSLPLIKWGDLWGSLQFTAFSLYMILRDKPENFTSNLNKFKRINSPLFFMETWLNQWLSNVFRRYRTKITREISSQWETLVIFVSNFYYSTAHLTIFGKTF